ncbi:MAG: hypothetical protein GQ529_13155, partial [Methyloprofundus sp.]|nr:hypothetical protein [Methyloprofundus sp.]
MRLSQLVVAAVLISSTFSVFAAVTRYTITDLTDLYSSVRIRSLTAVNSSGQVVGEVPGSIPGWNGSQAFITDKSGNMIIFDTLGEEPVLSSITDINDSGQVVGEARVDGV